MSDGAEPLAVSEESRVSLAQLGWCRRSDTTQQSPPGHGFSRVAVEHRGAYELVNERGIATGALDAAARDAAQSPFDYPTVGDWVIHTLEPRHDRRVGIAAVLDRTSLLCRRARGARPQPQLVAANADVLAVVTTARQAGDVATSPTTSPTTRTGTKIGARYRAKTRTKISLKNDHRIEWYLTAAFGGGTQPVIVVNKIDTVSRYDCEQTVDALRVRLGAANETVPIIMTSAIDGRGLDQLGDLTGNGATVALSGPSGVGKSSLVNRLARAEVAAVAPLSPDGRGRHTTVRRQLVPVGGSSGGTVVDSPGLQNLVPWAGDLGLSAYAGALDGLATTFSDVAELAQHCRFADCAHGAEPDCAVGAAVEAGEMAPARLRTYLHLVADMEAGSTPGASPSGSPGRYLRS